MLQHKGLQPAFLHMLQWPISLRTLLSLNKSLSCTTANRLGKNELRIHVLQHTATEIHYSKMANFTLPE